MPLFGFEESLGWFPMAGTPTAPLVKWFISNKKKGITYYLADDQNDTKKLVWTQQKAKAKKFDSVVDAEKKVEEIKSSHKNKKLDLKVM